jgi:hemoglobin/transferrin/lactoferrin receptor protein
MSIHTPTPVLCLLALACATAYAQPADAASEAGGYGPQVVVSASRHEQPIDDLPLSIDAIGSRRLEEGQIQDIRDIARTLPNVSVKRAPARFSVTGRGNPVGADGNAGFSIRGQGGNRVVLLADGIRLPRSYINGSNAFSRDTVALGLLKRVELVRGPTSALFGSDGLAGLVNFITHEPADFLVGAAGETKSLGGKLWLRHGTDDDDSAAGSTLAGRFSPEAEWLLTAGANQAGALKNMGRNNADNLDRTAPNPQHSKGTSLLGKLVLLPAAGQRHVLTLEHVTKDSDVDLLSSRAKPPYTGSAAQIAALVVAEDSTKSMARNRLTWDARYALQAAWADKLQTTLTWQDSEARDQGKTQRKDGGVRLRDTRYDERALQATLQADKTLQMSAQWSQTITYGIDVNRTDISSFADGFDPAPLPSYTPKRYFPDTRDGAEAFYIQGEVSDGRWSITPGVRLDRFSLKVLSQDGYYPTVSATPGKSLSGRAASPKLGVLWRASPAWSVYGNAASGFRAPEGQQINSALEVSTARLLPNPDLKPEASRNLEIGLRTRLGGLSLDLAAFQSRYSQLIVEKKNLGTANGGTATTSNPTLFQTVNIERATISGFEIRGQMAWGAAAGGQWSSPFSYGQARGTDGSTGLKLNHLDPAKLNLGLRLESGAWQAQLDVFWQDAKRASDLGSTAVGNAPNVGTQFTIPAATTLDLSAQWQIRKGLRLNLAVINLGRQKYWHWSDVQGLRTVPDLADAYTQPGRHFAVSLVADF